jgi:hypothetical protein
MSCAPPVAYILRRTILGGTAGKPDMFFHPGWDGFTFFPFGCENQNNRFPAIDPQSRLFFLHVHFLPFNRSAK